MRLDTESTSSTESESASSFFDILRNVKRCFASKIRNYVTSLQNKIGELCNALTSKETKIQELTQENETLIRELHKVRHENISLRQAQSEMLSTQEKRVEIVKEIASMENENIKNYVRERKQDSERLAYNTMLSLDAEEIINSHNPVLSTFVNEITKSNTENGNGVYGSTDSLVKKKTLRRAFICESVLGTADLKYISPLAFAPLLLAYGVTGSKLNCEIMSQAIPCGSYNKLQEFLSKKVEPPGLASSSDAVVYAFDNNQRIMRSWLCRNFNKQVVEIMTNILRINVENNALQFDKDLHPNSWKKYDSFEQFSLNFDHTPNDHITQSLKELTQSIFEDVLNNPDRIEQALRDENFAASTITCPRCKTVYPKSKLKCNVCHIFIRRELASISNSGDYLSTRITPKHANASESKISFHNYVPSENGVLVREEKMEVTSSSSCDQQETFTLIDPLFVNPASLAAVEKILEHIGKDAGIKCLGYGNREWAFVVCDGSPMTLVLRLIDEQPEKFSWVVPIVGLGHEEMNMVKSFVEFSWDFMFKEFAESQGYKSAKSLAFVKGCGDHHMSFDNLKKFREAVWYEIIFSFVNDPNVTSYNFDALMCWKTQQSDATLTFLIDTVLRYCESIFVFRRGVRTSNDDIIQAARSSFRDLWYGRNHTKYQLIDFYNQLFQSFMPPQMLSFLRSNQVVSRSGRSDCHQGVDFVLEEFNKDIKKWVSGVPDSNKWNTVIRNHSSLGKLRSLLHTLLSLPLQESKPRYIPDYIKERDEFRKLLRKTRFTTPLANRSIISLDKEVKICQEIQTFPMDCKSKSFELLQLIQNNGYKYPKRKLQTKLPVTEKEKDSLKTDSNRKNAELLAMINENVRMLDESVKGEWVSRMRTEKITRAKQNVLLQFLSEIREEVDSINVQFDISD